MSGRAAAPWRQLAVLTALVLLVHVLLLEGAPRRLKTDRLQPAQFATRLIVQAPATAAPPAPAAAAPRPVPIPPPRPRPAPPPQRIAAAEPPPPAPAPAPQPAPPQPAPPVVDPSSEVQALPPPPDAGATPYTPPALSVPAPAHIHYEVRGTWRGIPIGGRARLDWTQDGQSYEARFEASGLIGSRHERSTGRITERGLVPEYYAAKGTRSEQATHFDRDNGQLVFSNNQPRSPIADGMQDRLSVVVQLSMLVAADPARFQPGTEIAVPTADTRSAETWIFSVEGEEDLDLPGGHVRGLKLQRQPRKEFDQKVELWLAPGLDYAPVRLRLTNPNGDTVDQRWSSTDKG